MPDGSKTRVVGRLFVLMGLLAVTIVAVWRAPQAKRSAANDQSRKQALRAVRRGLIDSAPALPERSAPWLAYVVDGALVSRPDAVRWSLPLAPAQITQQSLHYSAQPNRNADPSVPAPLPRLVLNKSSLIKYTRPASLPAAPPAPKVEAAPVPVAAETTTPIATDKAIDERLALKPAKLQPSAEAELTLPPPAADEALSPEAAGRIWQRPDRLLAQLEAVAAYPACSAWARRVAGCVTRLTAEPAITNDERASLLDELAAAMAETQQLLASLPEGPEAAAMRRVAQAVARRLNVWRGVQAAEVATDGHLVALPDPARLAHCLATTSALTAGPQGQAWREYLMLESLGQLGDMRVEYVGLRERSIARQVLMRMNNSRLTPEQRRFIGSDTLAALDAELRHWAAERVNLPALLARLERYESHGLPSAGNAVAVDLRRMALSPMAEQRELARQIEEHYRGGNVRLVVHRGFFEHVLPAQKPVDGPVRETILGRPVCGCSTTNTQLAVKLSPDPARARLTVEAQGNVRASTSSKSGPVTVLNSSQSTFTARKEVELTTRGIRTGGTQVDAQTQTQLRGVETSLDFIPVVGPVVRSAAENQYQRQREAARQESQQKVAMRAGQQVDAALGEAIGDANRQLQARVLVPLGRLSLDPLLVESRTDENRLTLRLRLATDEQLAAATPRPRAPGDSLVSVQIHESAVNNILDRLELNGRRFTGKELYEHIGRQFNLQPAPEPDESFADSELTFAERDAVRVRCDAGRLEITLAIAHLKSGSRQWRNFVVSASYMPTPAGPAIELVRDGPISLSGERLNVQSQFVLRGTFNRVFSDDRAYSILAKELAEPQLAGLQITQFVIDDGWLAAALGPRRETPPVLASKPATRKP